MSLSYTLVVIPTTAGPTSLTACTTAVFLIVGKSCICFCSVCGKVYVPGVVLSLFPLPKCPPKKQPPAPPAMISAAANNASFFCPTRKDGSLCFGARPFSFNCSSKSSLFISDLIINSIDFQLEIIISHRLFCDNHFTRKEFPKELFSYFAKSVALVSLIITTFTCPGYCNSFSIRCAMS